MIVLSVILYKDFIIIFATFTMRRKKILLVSCLFGFSFNISIFFIFFILKGKCYTIALSQEKKCKVY